MNIKEIILSHSTNSGDYIPDYKFASLEDAINGWAKQKCKEQRELCYKEMRMYPDIEQGDIDGILSAPEPKFD